ncbi:MAG: acyl-CoA dehydratase activase [Armatimonadota bacterium]
MLHIKANRMKIYCGIDSGSLSTDCVLWDGNKIISYSIMPTLTSAEKAANIALESCLSKTNYKINDIAKIVTTGYGRYNISNSDKAVTEITCHARGARKLFDEVMTIIDIGGQDSKIIKLTPEGRVDDFVMNDKCAAGTGRFLEVMAIALGTDIENMGELSLKSKNDISISSTCTVFAESEIIGLISRGIVKSDIAYGLHKSVAERIFAMTSRLKCKPPYIMTGGVAKNIGVVRAVSEKLEYDVIVPNEPQIVGALGAVLISTEI